MPYRFKVDENLPVEVVQALIGGGHDAMSAEEQGLAGAPDEELAKVSREEGRVLVTLDLDFADIRSYPPERFPGVVVLRLARQDKASALRATERVLSVLSTMAPSGRLFIVEDERVRARGGDDGEDA